ncbi:lysozyme X [Drosophila eugracilis]|uniref:lysozyme X n=1 Tax=Drosophila eugracilis TaxID=29029 RepID=UPI0007E8A714|nr:lysozyme X [Drosophila eugracilis]
MRALLAICVLFVATPVILARTMDRCSLAREMASMGIPRDQLAKWACIAERESNYRTSVVGPPNSDGSNDYGIFQINDRYWCQPSNGKFSHNGCDVDCDELLSDDITESVKCAQTVLREHGFPAWTTWKYCNGYLPSIDDCFPSGFSANQNAYSSALFSQKW